jgi:hypothetical protein
MNYIMQQQTRPKQLDTFGFINRNVNIYVFSGYCTRTEEQINRTKKILGIEEKSLEPVENKHVIKKSLRIKSAEEQIDSAKKQKSAAQVRRRALYASLDTMLPQFVKDQNGKSVSPIELTSRLHKLKQVCKMNSGLAFNIGSKVLKDRIKKLLKESGLQNREKAELELLALIDMTLSLEALLAYVRSQ